MDIRESEREWREFGRDKRARSAFLMRTLVVTSLFLGGITLVAVLLAVLGSRSWGVVMVLLIIDAISLLGLYGFLGLYLPFMYRLGKRRGEKRRREGRVSFLDRPVGEGRPRDSAPRTKNR